MVPGSEDGFPLMEQQEGFCGGHAPHFHENHSDPPHRENGYDPPHPEDERDPPHWEE